MDEGGKITISSTEVRGFVMINLIHHSWPGPGREPLVGA
jgi:hypothetical protein